MSYNSFGHIARLELAGAQTRFVNDVQVKSSQRPSGQFSKIENKNCHKFINYVLVILMKLNGEMSTVLSQNLKGLNCPFEAKK